MKTSRYAVVISMSMLAACHSSGGGGGVGTQSPPPSPPQTFAAKVTAVEAVRAADQRALPVTGLPSQAGGTIIVTP